MKKDIQIICSDNLILLKEMEANSIDLIYIDVPYCTGKKFKDYNDSFGTLQESIDFFLVRIKEMHRVLKETGSIYVHCNWRFDSHLRIILDEVFGAKNFRNRIARKFSKEVRDNSNYSSHYDVILYYTKSNKFTFNLPESKQHFSNIWDEEEMLDNYAASPEYSTPKPIAVVERVVQTSSNPGDLVLDCFCGGSAATAIACIKNGRKAIVCDISKKAFEITKRKVENYEV